MTSACASRTSFHYHGCGCGALPWRGDVDGLWSTLDSGRASGDASRPPAPRRLRVSYLIPHHNVTGGMKMIMKQVGAAAVRARVCACVQRVWSSGVALVTPAPNVFFKPPLCALRWVPRVQIELLCARGHDVEAVFRAPPGAPVSAVSVLPPWVRVGEPPLPCSAP
jgi:hypothetical protein